MRREVSLFMMQGEQLHITDYVVVHMGYAIQKISQQDAEYAWGLYYQMLSSK